jgi:hypothetical protein
MQKRSGIAGGNVRGIQSMWHACMSNGTIQMLVTKSWLGVIVITNNEVPIYLPLHDEPKA